MKKLLLILPAIALLAAACNSTQPTVEQNQQQEQATPQSQTSTDSNTKAQTPPSVNQNTNAQAEVKWKNFEYTTSAKNRIKFQYPENWTVGKFANLPQQFTLQPSDNFKAEATSKAIVLSVSGHCMNTQCLTVFSLDDMVKELGLKVISKATIKGTTGYYVRTPDNGYAYVFIVGDDYITVRTDIYQTWLTKIVGTLEISAGK